MQHRTILILSFDFQSKAPQIDTQVHGKSHDSFVCLA